MKDIPKFEQDDLIERVYQVGKVREKHPEFALWLGAGASVESNVPSASQMVLETLQERYDRQRSKLAKSASELSVAELHEWAIKKGWYKPGHRKKSIYAQVMERAYPTPDEQEQFLSQRLEYVHPSRGYEILGLLLRDKVFDTIITTNFDHLVRVGSNPFLHPPLEEINTPDQFELLSPIPRNCRLLRLHGDFWRHNPAITPGDLEQVSDAYFRNVKRLLRDYGLIVIGYGGWDFNVKDKLFNQLWDNTAVLRKGLYWCHRREDPVLSPSVKALLKSAPRGRAFLVEIDSFEDFMSRLANKFTLRIPWDEYLDQLKVSWEFESILSDLIEALDLRLTVIEGQRFRQRSFYQLLTLLGAERGLLASRANSLKGWNVTAAPNHLFPRLEEKVVTRLLGQLNAGNRDYHRISNDEHCRKNIFYDFLKSGNQVESFPMWRGDQLIGLVAFASKGQPLIEQQRLRLIRAAVKLLVGL